MAKNTTSPDTNEENQDFTALNAEATGDDKLTRRARPLFLYLMYFCILICFAGAIVGLWFPQHVEEVAYNLQILLKAIPEELWWLFGAGYLGYTGSRSFDKWKSFKK